MDDRLRGFGGLDVYTLLVGQGEDAEALSIPKNILLPIPFFKTALQSGAFQESTTKTFELPEEDPVVVADVIFWSYTGGTAAPRLETEDHMLRAWMLADKWMAEGVANKIIDVIIDYYQIALVPPSNLTYLLKAGYNDTALYDVLFKSFAWNYLQHGGRLSGVDWYEEWIETHFTRDQLLELFKITNKVRIHHIDPVRFAAGHICKLHKHDISEKCRMEVSASIRGEGYLDFLLNDPDAQRLQDLGASTM